MYKDNMRKDSKKITVKELDLLYWFSCGEVLYLEVGTSKKKYRISGCGHTMIDDISENTVISLVKKNVIRPVGLSVKEWEVQRALGVDGDIEFDLTEEGMCLGIKHLSCDERNAKIKERIARMERYRKHSKW